MYEFTCKSLNIYMYIHAYVDKHMWYLHIYVYIYVHIHVYIYMYIYTCIFIYICIHEYTSYNTYICIYMHTHYAHVTYVHVYMHIRIHVTYIYVHIYTYTHTRDLPFYPCPPKKSSVCVAQTWLPWCYHHVPSYFCGNHLFFFVCGCGCLYVSEFHVCTWHKLGCHDIFIMCHRTFLWQSPVWLCVVGVDVLVSFVGVFVANLAAMILSSCAMGWLRLVGSIKL